MCGCCCNGSSNGIGDREAPFTRIVEHKHFEMMGEAVNQVPKTIITKEYPAEYSASEEAYYPINNEENNKRYRQYKALADQEKDVIFGGRLAEYKYYDMDDTIKRAIYSGICRNQNG